jgi:hypothetical protein
MTDGLYAKDLEDSPLRRWRPRLGCGGGRQRKSWSCRPRLYDERYYRMREPGRGSLEDHHLPNLTVIEVRGHGMGRRRVRDERRRRLACIHRGNPRNHHDVVAQKRQNHQQSQEAP